MAGVPSVDDVNDALANVIDPELGLDFVELGLIYEVEVDGGHVHVTFTLTSPGCPIGPQVTDQIREFVGELDGVQQVDATMTFSPPWTPDMMSEDAKFALGY
jgi:metal-sulfur cluster biosynthetic enzyme